jgi:hypothetical protein
VNICLALTHHLKEINNQKRIKDKRWTGERNKEGTK